MNKKILIIAVTSLGFVLVLLLVIFLAAKPTPQPVPSVLTPTSEPTIEDKINLQIVSTSPESNQSGVALESKITLVFNRTVSQSEVSFEFLDDAFKPVAFKQGFLGTKVILTPNAPLLPSMVYLVRIRGQYQKILHEFRFLTLTLEPSPDTRPVPLITKIVGENRAKHPDIFLNNELPYQSFDFNMESVLDSEGYFNFIVTSNRLSGEMLKERVHEWLLGLKLTEAQIATLRLVYR